MNNGDGGPKKLIEFDWDDPKLPIQVFEAITDEDVDAQHAAGMLGILLAQQCLLQRQMLKLVVAAVHSDEGKTTADEPVPEPVQENLFE